MKTYKQFIFEASPDDGKWITMHGRHVFIKNGVIIKGGSGLPFKSINDKLGSAGKLTKRNSIWDSSPITKIAEDNLRIVRKKREHLPTDWRAIAQEISTIQTLRSKLDNEMDAWKYLERSEIGVKERIAVKQDAIKRGRELDNKLKEELLEWYKPFKDIVSEAAFKASESATTKEEHIEARRLHVYAYNAINFLNHKVGNWDPSEDERKKLSLEWISHKTKIEYHEKALKSISRKEKLRATLDKKRAEKERALKGEELPLEKFYHKNINEIREYFENKHGLIIASKALVKKSPEYYKDLAEYDEARKLYNNLGNQKYFSKDANIIEKYEKAKEEYRILRQMMQDKHWKYEAEKIQGFTPLDMSWSNRNNDYVRKNKQLLVHIDNTLDNLKARGFDVDKMLRDKGISYSCGSLIGRRNGMAWHKSFSLSLHNLSEENDYDKTANMQNISATYSPWTVGEDSATLAEEVESVIHHELVHAVGIPEKSPEKIDKILSDLFPDFEQRKKWLKENVSRYSLKNINETDAEVCTKVLKKDYKPGTFPKEIENHVYQLFKKKSE